MSGIVFLYAQRYFFKCGITTITAENFETILSVSTKSELKVN